MESIYYTRLKNRDLWVDGTSSLDTDGICHKILSGESVEDILSNEFITGDGTEEEVFKFLKLVPKIRHMSPKVKDKTSVLEKEFDTSFNIPEEYLHIDIEKFLVESLIQESREKNLSEAEKIKRIERIRYELEKLLEHGLLGLVNLSLYLVDTMKKHNVVWGPGRGSSCCSYILYLVGLHCIDSVEFDLQFDEFIR